MAFTIPGLLGMTNQQPDPYQTLLGGYYTPQQAKMAWLGGTLQGLGAGLASGKSGAWAQGLALGGGEGLDNYRQRAMVAAGLQNRKDEQAYQHEQDAAAQAWREKTFAEDARRYGMDYALRKQEARSQADWNNIARSHQQKQWAQEDAIQQGQTAAVTDWRKNFETQGGTLFSPQMQAGLRQAGVEGVDPNDTVKYNQTTPFVNAGDYNSAFQQMTAPGAEAKTYTLSPGQVVKDSNGRTIAEGAPKEDDPNNNPFQNGTKLRKEYMDEAKPYTDLRTNYQKIQASSQDNTGASDIALVYSFMKMLDPTSVVREGEFATAANAGGVDSKIVTLYNSALNGQKLSPQVRQEFVQQAGRQFEQQAQTYQKIKKKYEGMAQQYGLDPSLVAPDITYGIQAASAQTIQTHDGYTIELVK